MIALGSSENPEWRNSKVWDDFYSQLKHRWQRGRSLDCATEAQLDNWLREQRLLLSHGCLWPERAVKLSLLGIHALPELRCSLRNTTEQPLTQAAQWTAPQKQEELELLVSESNPESHHALLQRFEVSGLCDRGSRRSISKPPQDLVSQAAEDALQEAKRLLHKRYRENHFQDVTESWGSMDEPFDTEALSE
eukprot:CAMPEP_0184293430 /NCGR_PEP_ID=MMETSP1049-20130417/4857_1 /TAXON_ID=77928 /ORGANISM="Proteomonas sulcata, Strain CCMP704" /LENGTH=191 /DNA_ID=CAMNT_0026601399 /DNA_START=375 /DNA_END=950 /DNA_ORIENTATION=-